MAPTYGPAADIASSSGPVLYRVADNRMGRNHGASEGLDGVLRLGCHVYTEEAVLHMTDTTSAQYSLRR